MDDLPAEQAAQIQRELMREGMARLVERLRREG